MEFYENKRTWYLDELIPDYETFKEQIVNMIKLPQGSSIDEWYNQYFWQNFYNKYCKSNVAYINPNHFYQDLMTMYNDVVLRNSTRLQKLYKLYNLSPDDISLLSETVNNFATQMNREIQPNEIINRVRDQAHARVNGGSLERLFAFITNIPTLDLLGELEVFKRLFIII